MAMEIGSSESIRNRPWTDEELQLLGTLPDREFAALFGRSLQAIVVKRYVLKIPRYVAPGESGRPWSTEDDALLGTDSDGKIAKQLDRTALSVTKRREYLKIAHYRHRPWTPEE